MKEDYLWNKTGDDAEIKRLEETLAVFRSRTDMPPVIVPETAKEKNGFSSWFTGFRLAFAATATATAAIAIAAILIWFPTSRGQLQVNVEEVQPATNVAPPKVSTVVTPQESSEIPKTVTPTLAKANEPAVKQRRPTQQRRKQTNFASQTARNDKPAFTAEELYAYQQLMLALSITNSKLKIVRDTMTGADVEHKKTNHTDKR